MDMKGSGVSRAKVGAVRSALTRACLDAGCKDFKEVRSLASKAAGGLRKYQVAAVKAHVTMGTY